MADNPKKPAPKKTKPKEFDPSKLSDKQLQSGFGGKEAQGIAQLAAAIKEQNKVAQGEKSDKERDDKLASLLKETKRGDKEGKAQLLSLRQGIIDTTERLRQANEDGDEKLIRLEEKNLESLSDSIDTTEKEREAKKATEKQSKLLEGIKGGIGNLANKFKDNAGFLAGLAGVALAVFNPEKLKEIIDRTVGAIVDAFDIVAAVFSGDFSLALEKFSDNWKDLSLLIGGLAIFNFSKIAAFIGTIKSGFLAVFGSGGAVATVASFFGVGAGAAFGIIIAIAAGIAAVIYSIVETVKATMKTFEETDSAFEAFKTAVTELPARLFGIIPDLIKKAIAWVAEKLGFEEFANTLNEFSFIDAIRNINIALFDGFTAGVNYIKDKIKEGIAKGPDIFNSIVDTIVDALESLTEKFKEIGIMVKALGQASLAAIKAAPAAVFGGEDPRDVFKKTYNDIISGGDGSGEATLRQIDMEAATRGEELDTSSMDNKMDGQFLQTAAPAVNVVNNVDNSNNSKTSNTAIGGRSRRKRGFATDTELAYG